MIFRRYLVQVTSRQYSAKLDPYTKQDLKAYKSQDGYKYLLAGWVGDLSSYNLSLGNFVVKAKVGHSQTVLAQPAQPWTTAEPKGTIYPGSALYVYGRPG